MTTETDETPTGAPGTFTKPAPRTPMATLNWREAERREDDPPPEVPRDQWERPIIVLPDGSGVISYIRASKYGKLIRDGRAITKWDERNIVWGLSRGHHLVARASGVRTLTAGPDIGVLEDIAEQAKVVAGAHAGAMTGSGLHALHARRAAGEDLSWLDPTLMLCLDAITDLLDPRIFEILCTEGDDDLGRTFVVHDGLCAAGSFDLVVRLLVDLTWPDGVTIERGTILVVDLKTGKITSAPYWSTEFTCQQLTYAEGTPYRPGVTHLADPKVRSVKNVIKVTDQPGENGRITWADIGIPERPDQRYSLILHVPALSPGDAHWERVDLDAARADAIAAHNAHARARVNRAGRFLALPHAALVPTDHRQSGDVSSVDSEASTPPGQQDSDHFNPRLHAILAERITRAESTDTVDAIYDAWHTSPTWDARLTTACQGIYDRLAAPPGCAHCEADRHTCPGCGIPVPHGVPACGKCNLRIDLENAPDLDTLDMLWEAHAPVEQTESGTGDGLWDAGEHTPVAVAREKALTPTERGPRYPLDVPAVENLPMITLWCHECLLPVDHPQTSDPVSWCDCQPGETCSHQDWSCRQRAHDPDTCVHRPAEPEQPTEPPEPNPLAPGIGHSGPADRPEPDLDPEPDTEGSAGENGGDEEDPDADGVGDAPGPFDSTMDLSDLRDLIEQALDTDTLDTLYDAHCAREEGGDGLWTDDLNGVAQAAYDRITTGQGASE